MNKGQKVGTSCTCKTRPDLCQLHNEKARVKVFDTLLENYVEILCALIQRGNE